jgi:hypothetical protein
MIAVLRPAGVQDIAWVHDLISTVWTETYGPYVSSATLSRVTDDDAVRCHIALTIDGMIIAESQGKIVGVVSENDGWISGWFVSARYRRVGIGSMLLHSAEMRGGGCMEIHAFNLTALMIAYRRGWQLEATFQDDVWGTQLTAHAMALKVRTIERRN